MSGVRTGAISILLLRCALLAALAAWFLPATDAGAELVDRVVASVNNDVITLSELQQAVAFNRAVAGAGAGTQVERETLEGIINRKLLVQEAARLGFVEVSKADVDAERERIRTRIGSDEAYRAFLAQARLTEAQLDRMLGERLLVERFIQKKIGLLVRISHDEAESYFREHAEQFKGMRFPEAQPQIMAKLTAERAGKQLDQYLTDVRSRAEIRVNPLGDE